MKSRTIADISQCLLDKARAEQFAGYDPFDGLNSSWFSWMPVSKDSTFGLAFSNEGFIYGLGAIP